ncbi:DUF2723 domain-containing protein, partial [Candidatus Bathyarchaeota archaeon]|nr:DUF2723 domain-containing protein [Candidatus Bathyarchaeota archaeon]
MEQSRRTATCLVIVAVAIGYYAILAAKQWTWMFVSGDSGDWLASSTIWMTPQPFGSPLYVMLGQFLNLFPGDLVIKMTMMLSVLPAAITVAVVYLIVRARGHGQKLALLGSGILLACGIFLSQATVLEEYTLASMFVT